MQSSRAIVGGVGRPGYCAIGRMRTAGVDVLVIHVVKRIGCRLQARIEGSLLAGSVAVGHALAPTPGSIRDVRGKAGYVLCVYIGPDHVGRGEPTPGHTR